MHTTMREQGDVCTDHSMVMAWSKIGPAIRKQYEMTNYGHLLTNADMMALQGQEQEDTTMQPLKTRIQTKLGSIEPKC